MENFNPSVFAEDELYRRIQITESRRKLIESTICGYVYSQLPGFILLCINLVFFLDVCTRAHIVVYVSGGQRSVFSIFLDHPRAYLFQLRLLLSSVL